MSEGKRLHPIAILLNVGKILKEAFIPVMLFVVFQSGNDSAWSYIELLILGAYFLGSLLYGALSWFKFTYQIVEDEIRIHSGIFVKKKRYIRLERIQSIDITEGIIQRFFSLVKVTIETAGSSNGGEAEGELTAITKDEAALFQTLLQVSKKKSISVDGGEELSAESENGTRQERKLFEMPFGQLFLMAATSGGVGVVFSGAFVLYSQFSEVIALNGVYEDVEKLVRSSMVLVAGLIFIGIVLAYLIATVRVILKYAYFTVFKSGDELIISRGLFERRRLSIPIHRIQAVRIVENIVRQPFGYATLYVETASGSIQNEGNAKVMLLPLVKKEYIKSLLASFEIKYEVELPMKHVPKRAMRRYLFRALLWNIPLIAFSYLFKPFGYVFILWLPLCIAVGYASYRSASWNIEKKQLTLVFRQIISKQTYIVLNNKIQSFTLKQSKFQRKQLLGTVCVYSKTGIGPSRGRVIDLEQEDLSTIKEWFMQNHSVRKTG